MSDIISILWSVFKVYFIPLTIFASLIVILLTLAIIRYEKIIKWYLGLKLSNTQLGHPIDQNKFNKLVKNWTNYNIALTSLWFHSAILIGGFLFSFCSQLIFIYSPLNWTIGIAIGFILFFVEIIIATNLLKKRISLLLKIKENSLILGVASILLASIPFWIVSFYIIFNKPELNFNTLIAIILILTLGMYESTKEIISFVFPIPENGIYSIDEIIEEQQNGNLTL